jgi:Lrp/AsnC family transcriptional regulator
MDVSRKMVWQCIARNFTNFLAICTVFLSKVGNPCYEAAMPEKIFLDAADRRILTLLQQDSALSLAEIGEVVGLSPTPCWKRIRRLEAAGVIRARVALLDPAAVGLGVTAFVAIKAGAHDKDWLTRFSDGVAQIPEVVELYRMAGDTDYLLKVVCHDIAHYDRIYRRLIQVAPMGDVSSSFAMERMKATTALPLTEAP